MATIKELKNTSIGWRFTDENYNLLDEKTIKGIDINSIDESNLKWFNVTKSKETHLIKLPSSFWESLKKEDVTRIEWGEEELSKNSTINKYVDFSSNEVITFFWGANNSVQTTWNIFIKYWDDFCYPDDENNLIIINDTNILITYIEEKFSIYTTLNSGKISL